MPAVEHITSVVARIQTIESRVRADLPPVAFEQTLARAAAPAEAAPAAGGAVAKAATRRPATLTLAQMLGRPVAPTGPTADTPATSPAAPTLPGPAGSGELRLPVDARVSSTFGPRVHPITGQMRPHNGIDLAAPTGTPIAAAAAGTVTFSGVQGGYGNIVIIDHGDGTETRYAHQDTLGVTTGQTVEAGQQIGTVGSTGASTGPHLHFEFRRGGEPVDPAPLLGL